MTKAMKRLYMIFLAIYTIIIAGCYLMVPTIKENTTLVNVNLVVTYVVIALLASTVMFLEFRLNLLNKYFVILHVIVGFFLPIGVFFISWWNLLALSLSVVFLVVNIFIKNKTRFQFDINDYSIINTVYIVAHAAAILIVLTNQMYWFLSIPLIILALLIDGTIYFALRGMNRHKEVTFISILLLLLFIYVFTFNTTINLSGSTQLDFIQDIFKPILIIGLTVVTAILNKKQLERLIKDSSTE